MPNQLQFHTGASQSFVVKMPGGVFAGHTAPFELNIDGPDWTPVPALRAIAQPLRGQISNYIFENGENCHASDDDPPEILIGT